MTTRRSLGVFLAAVAVALVVGVLLRNTYGYAVRNPDGTINGDIEHYIYWSRLVTLGGVQDAYKGTWPETYAVYPPVTLYGLQAVGNLYRAAVDPSYDAAAAMWNPWLVRAIKASALLWHLFAAAAVYAMALRLGGARRAAWAGAFVAASPAGLYGAAHWAQPDGAHSGFAVLAIGLLTLGYPVVGWVAMGMAMLAKPQAWALLPLLLVGTWTARRFEGLVRGGIAAATTAVIILLPFLLTARLGELLTLPRVVATVMPVVSANAHNVWWLVFAARGENPLLALVSTPLFGAVTVQAASTLLVLGQFMVTYWLYWSRRTTLAESAALGALGWFVFTTQAHANHLYFALPILALAWAERPRLWLPFAVLNVTVLLNMALHDPFLLEYLGLPDSGPPLATIRNLNAVANLLCWLGWMTWAALRPAGSTAGAQTTLPSRAKLSPQIA